MYEKSDCAMHTRVDSSGNVRTTIGNTRYSLRKIVISKKNIILMREDTFASVKYNNCEVDLGLNKVQEFTYIFLSSPGTSRLSVTVVGSLSMITEKVTGLKENV
jgi:hypothetical protein